MAIEKMPSDTQREKLSLEVAVFAFVIKRWPNRDEPGTDVVLIRCPLCGDEHVHGGERGRRLLGNRGAHCRLNGEKSLTDYYVVDFRPAPELRFDCPF